MKINNIDFKPYIDHDKLQATVARMAQKIDRDYANTSLMVCPVLTGAFVFAADLVRQLKSECEISFVKYTSYEGMQSSGKVGCQMPFSEKMRGRHVLIVEDVIDSGLSMAHMLQQVSTFEPCSVKVCTLFFKPNMFRQQFKPDYVGLEIADDFIVGYGLDFDGKGRQLPDVWIANTK
ncbi:MAG: hypoxanthine phosphoribosyltransferase [Bacteroidales bacterium]|nr:hypoxanthine phosphoribosyltransferase [Bacteroidales bacterium]